VLVVEGVGGAMAVKKMVRVGDGDGDDNYTRLLYGT